MIRKISFLFSFLLLISSSYSQKYNFKNYTVANGLGSSTLNHIFQDSKGYIWFATQGGGVSRFNGKEFKSFTRADGLISNDVTYITEDKRKHLWIATAEGASEFDGNKFTNYNAHQGLTDGVVYCIYADAENKIWFALQEGGIRTFDGNKFDSIRGLPSNEAYCITQDKHGSLWFGLGNGIAKYTNGKITDYRSSDLIKDKTFFSSMTDADGNIWFGSTTGDVVIIRTNNSIEKLELPAEIKKDFIGSITQNIRGNIWFGTDHGLLKYTGKEFKLFSEREGLSVNTVQAVMVDYEDNIWAGTLNGGVNLLSSEAFVHYTEKDGLTSANVTAICPDLNRKTYYIGTGDGLYVFNPASKPGFKKVTHIKAIEKINISSLSLDSKGHLWISAQEGVFVLEKKGESLLLKKEYQEIDRERIISPLKIIHDSKGNTWIATYGSGIFLINEKITKVYNTNSDKILTVYEDSKANIWFGTQDAGAIKYDGEVFTPIVLPDKAVWSVAEDKSGIIFFGTGESGIYRYDGKRVTAYTAKDGLSSDYVPVLKFDNNENCLWLGSEKGLDKLKFTADYKIEKVHSYKEQDGFKSVGINQNGICIDEAGKVWLGTVNGLWLFNSNYDFVKTTSPKIQLTDIRLSYQKVDWKNFTDTVYNNLPVNLKLAYKKNHLTFDIQALTTDEVSYTCILEGQDQEWSSPTKNNEITYSNISPGEYVFKAKAVNSEGVGSSETILFAFAVNPPWWNTWWFRIAVFLAVIISLIAFIKARENVLKQQNLKLEETVKQRTLEISHQKELVEKTLTEKEGLLHEKEILLKEIHHRVKNNLQTISSMLMLQSAGLKDEEAKKAITESQSRVRSIALVHQKLYQTDGLEKVELNAFVKDLAVQIQSLYREQSKQVSIHCNIPETFLLIDAAIPLGLILNELFTNSFKYAFNNSASGEITISAINIENDTASVKSKSKKIKLIYTDSGPGLASPQILDNASTLGLRLIKLLSQQIGATLNYSNNNGSEFIFTFTINF